jgi:hypothetical protein
MISKFNSINMMAEGRVGEGLIEVPIPYAMEFVFMPFIRTQSELQKDDYFEQVVKDASDTPMEHQCMRSLLFDKKPIIHNEARLKIVMLKKMADLSPRFKGMDVDEQIKVLMKGLVAKALKAEDSNPKKGAPKGG